MSTVIKANAAHMAPQATAFNFDDLSKQAQAYLDKVRVQAQQIITEAQKQAQTIRQQAEKEGRAAGERAIEQVLTEQTAWLTATRVSSMRAGDAA